MRGTSRGLLVLFTFYFLFEAGNVSAQKAVRWINRGKYEKAESYSRQQILEFKNEDALLPPGSRYSINAYVRRIKPYHSLARLYKVKGDFVNCELYSAKADSIYMVFTERLKDKGSSGWKDFIVRNTIASDGKKTRQDKWYYQRTIDVANIYTRLGQLEKSKVKLDSVYKLMKTAYGEKTSMAKTAWAAYGEYFLEKGIYDSSRMYYERYILALYSDPNYFDISMKRFSDSYAGLSRTYLGSGNIPMALKAGKKAVYFANHRFVKATDGRNTLGKIETANLLAEVYRRGGNQREAIRWNSKAFEDYNSYISGVTPDKFSILATRGQIYWALSDTVKANDAFGELMASFFHYTQNNFSFLSESEREYFYRKNKYLVDLAKGYYAYLYFTRGHTDHQIARRLYEIHLNNKGVLLNSSSKLLNVLYSRGDKALIAEYEKIKVLRESRQRLIQTGETPEAVAALDEEIIQKERYLRNILSIDTEKFVSTSDILAAIPDSTHVIDILKAKIFISENDAAAGSGSTIHETKASRYIYFILDRKGGLKLVENKMSDENLEKRYYRGYLNAAKLDMQNVDIYNAFFGPIAPHLTFRNLVFSSDGIYNLINPEILFDGNDYLVNRYKTLSVVSAKDLLRFPRASPVLNDITLVGWPDYSTHSQVYKVAPVELPGTETEIRQITRVLPEGTNRYVYVRRDANEVKVKDISSTSILHFATHGFFEASTDRDPMYTSGLVLALSDSSRAEDGFLTAYEASNLDLKKTFLVVLSACETGQGEFEEGEGVWGLQRAFQVAGVRYIVMSLFKVDDEVTSLLMQEFYKNIVSGQEVLAAFRNSRMKIKSSYQKPVEWGAFVIKGY